MKSRKQVIRHATCGREFRTFRGLRTHVLCVPIAKPEASPAQVENAPAQASDEKAMTKRMIATATSYYMRTYELGFVKANMRARKLLARRIATTA